MRTGFPKIFLALALNSVVVSLGAAEQFKYYVWIDDQGIVHASEEAPKGRDYEVRIIEDINANVVPAEDFRLDDSGTIESDDAGQANDGAGDEQTEESAAPGAGTEQ